MVQVINNNENLKKLKICYLSAINPISIGRANGFKTNHDVLSKTFAARGHEVIVLGYANVYPEEKIVKRNGITYWCLPDKNASYFKRHFLILQTISRLKKLIREEKVEIIQSQGGYALPLLFIKSCVRVASIHGSEPFFKTPFVEKYLRIIFGRLIYPRLEGLILINKVLLPYASRAYGIPKRRFLIQNKPTLETVTARKKRFSANATVRIIAAGRLEPVKNLMNLILAVEALNRTGWKVNLEIYGEGPLRHKINQKYLKGHLDQKALWKKIANADIFIIPSITEVNPNSLYEAMQIGIVPIVSKLKTIRLIHESKNGYLIHGFEVQDIKNAINKALSDRSKWPKIAKMAQETIKNLPDEIGQIESYYYKLLRQSKKLLV